MSIKLKIKSIPKEIRERIVKELKIEKKLSKYEKVSKTMEPYYIQQKTDEIYLPFAWALENVPGATRPERKELPQINTKFVGNLRDNQKEVRDEAIKILNRDGSIILSLYCGFGKTFLAILLASKIGLKTLILCHRIVLIEQWRDSIKKVCPDASFQILDSKTEIDEKADFYIANAQNIEKFGFKPFCKIGTVIVDECHVIATDTLSKSLFYSTPRYMIGLSATPHRPDGMDILLEYYFGKNKISRQLFRKHTVYRVNTGIKFETKMTKDGKLDWNSIIEGQSENEERNKMILDIILKHEDRHFLVLCKRISQARYLIDKLCENGENVTSLLGNNNQFDQTSRILVATVQKCGVGFSHDILDALVIASDMEEYFIQYLGRVMRTEEVEPIIFDFVDEHPILQRHFQTRKKVYQESGGIIKRYNLEE